MSEQQAAVDALHRLVEAAGQGLETALAVARDVARTRELATTVFDSRTLESRTARACEEAEQLARRMAEIHDLAVGAQARLRAPAERQG